MAWHVVQITAWWHRAWMLWASSFWGQSCAALTERIPQGNSAMVRTPLSYVDRITSGPRGFTFCEQLDDLSFPSFVLMSCTAHHYHDCLNTIHRNLIKYSVGCFILMPFLSITIYSLHDFFCTNRQQPLPWTNCRHYQQMLVLNFSITTSTNCKLASHHTVMYIKYMVTIALTYMYFQNHTIHSPQAQTYSTYLYALIR